MVPQAIPHETGKDSCIPPGWFQCNLSEGAAGALCLSYIGLASLCICSGCGEEGRVRDESCSWESSVDRQKMLADFPFHHG